MTAQMSTIVVGEIPAGDFALNQTFERVPDVCFECERVVDHDAGVTMPLLWASDADAQAVHEALCQDDTVNAVTPLADFGDQQLYRIAWAPGVCTAVELLTDADGSILDARGEDGRWQVRVFYPDRRSVSIVNGGGDRLSFAMNRIGQLEQKSAVRYGLTDKQHEALRIGWNEGYFDVPRRIGIEELSGDLGVTHQAVSERLRRGQSTLIKEALGLSRGDEKGIRG